MSYHYEMKTVMKSKWKVYLWSIVVVCTFIVMMIMLTGLAKMNPFLFWTSFVQFMCGGALVYGNLTVKKVRVYDDEPKPKDKIGEV